MTSDDEILLVQCSWTLCTVQRGDCDNKWGSFDQLEKQSENAIVMRIIKERKQKLEKEKNNDDTNEYRHKERGGLRAINILADCPLTPTARNITHIYSRQLKCSRNYSSTVQEYCFWNILRISETYSWHILYRQSEHAYLIWFVMFSSFFLN